MDDDGLPRTVEEFEEILAARTVVAQACGILMERHGIDADLAFTRLREASQSHNGVKLREIARRLVATGELSVRSVDKPPVVRRVPGHSPAPLVAADLHLVECACGWRSWGYVTKARAEQEHVEHAAEAARSQTVA